MFTHTTRRNRIERVHHAATSVLSLVALWLILSPFVLGFSPREMVNEATSGVVLFMLEALRMETAGVRLPKVGGGCPPDRSMGMEGTANWLSGLMGVWLMVSPLVLDYADLRVGFWNVVVCGGIVVVLAVCGMATSGGEDAFLSS